MEHRRRPGRAGTRNFTGGELPAAKKPAPQGKHQPDGRDEAAARVARAERLHRQIDEIKSERPASSPPAAAEQAVNEPSPREFIHRRMRQLGQESDDSGD